MDERSTEMMSNEPIRLIELIHEAAQLKSDGNNPEYDRALVELCLNVAGWSMDDKDKMAQLIGIGGE
jgi:hypothetical protein